MIRGTTPTLEFALPFEVDLIAEAYVTISQNQSVVIDKSLSELTCAGKTLTVKLSQEDTLKLHQSEFKTAEVQIRVRMKSGDALASDVAKGKTFTSVAGVKVVGTREESGGSGGDTTLNAEVQTIANATSPSATFSGTGGTYKVYGYGKGTTSGYTTPQYAFCGDKYYTMASWGNPTPKSMTISVDENGNITGLPALASGNLTIVRTP